MSNGYYSEKLSYSADMDEDRLTQEQQELFAQKITERINNLLIKPGDGSESLLFDDDMLPHAQETNFLADGTEGTSVHVSSDWIPVGPSIGRNGQPDGSKIEAAIIQITDNVAIPYEQDGYTVNIRSEAEPEVAIVARLIEADGSTCQPMEIIRVAGDGVMLHESFDPASKAGWSMARSVLHALENHKMELLLQAREQNLPQELRREILIPVINAYTQQFNQAIVSCGSSHRDEVFAHVGAEDPELIEKYSGWADKTVALANETEDLSTIIHTNLLVLLPQIGAGFNDEEFLDECLEIINEMQEHANNLPVDDGLTNLIEQMVNQLRENSEREA